MGKKTYRIAQVSPRDIWSGAERIAWLLFHGLKERGLDSSMAVGIKTSGNPDIYFVPNGECYSHIRKIAWLLQQSMVKHQNMLRGIWRLSRFARVFVEAGSIGDSYFGREDYRYPGSWRLFQPPNAPDIVNFHNLHGGYFDLRALPYISNRMPTVLTLHDMWSLTGFCIYPMGCERWKTGCGNCPLLHTRQSVVPARIRKDGTAENWREKREIYAKSRLFIVTPSKWLMDKAKHSILEQSIIGERVIPYGIDLNVFCPGNRWDARKFLNIQNEKQVALAVGTGIVKNLVKGFDVIRSAMIQLGKSRQQNPLLLLVVGSKAPKQEFKGLEVRFIPHVGKPVDVARFYQAADVYIHGAKEDNFPNSVLEALACGTPVVSTATGGIPEQVKSARVRGIPKIQAATNIDYFDPERATGILVPVNNVSSMAKAVEWILENRENQLMLGKNAAIDAKRRFDLSRQIDDYIEVYESMIAKKMT